MYSTGSVRRRWGDRGCGTVVRHRRFRSLPLAVPDTTDDEPISFTGDAADIIIMPGVFADFSVQANRRKFIDASGKPFDLANAVAAFGTPCGPFGGDASTFGN
jgi:hypothetical protein